MNQDDKKIKILYLDHTPFIGGAQISLIEHLKKLDRQRFEPLVGCTAKAKELGLTDRYELAGLKYRFLAMERLKFWHPAALISLWKNINELRGLLKKEQIKLIFANTIRTSIVAALASITGDTKVVWYLQDYTFPRLLYKLLRFIPAKILYVSRSVADFYQGNKGAKDEVIHIWRNFYEQAEQVSEQQRETKRREWGVEIDMILVGFIGRLIEWKGAHVLLAAMAELIQSGATDIKAVFIGTGAGQQGAEYENRIKTMAADKGLEKNVIFTGFQTDIPVSMSALDIFCLTSIEPEPFSSVVIEAMMAKVPVIGTDIGGTPEIVKNRQTGLLVEADQADDLARAILLLSKDKLLRKNLADQAFDIVMKNNTGEMASRRLEAIYEQLYSRSVLID